MEKRNVSVSCSCKIPDLEHQSRSPPHKLAKSWKPSLSLIQADDTSPCSEVCGHISMNGFKQRSVLSYIMPPSFRKNILGAFLDITCGMAACSWPHGVFSLAQASRA